MITRHACLRTILTISIVLLVGCSSGGRAPDNTSPVITLMGDNPQVIAVGEAYAELGATASDNRDGDLTASIVIDASAVDSAVPGTYQVTYNVTDAAGNSATTVTRTVTVELTIPVATTLSVTGDIKTLDFTWSEVDYVDYYRLLENPGGNSDFTQIGDDIPVGTMTASRNIAVHLFDWLNAHYVIEACNVKGCSSSAVLTVADVLLDTIGYFKASNTDQYDGLNTKVALSADGMTLALASSDEDSAATGVDGDQANNDSPDSGAIYVYRNHDNTWIPHAYIKASNSEAGDRFGASVSLDEDGNTLAVGAPIEASSATGINGDQTDNSAFAAGAVYLFRFDGVSWAQQAYIKASNAGAADFFGTSLDLSRDGNTLAVGAAVEDSGATGVGGDQANNLVEDAGAAYIFRFDGSDWTQEAYAKSSDPAEADHFGQSVALAADGNTLAVGAYLKDGDISVNQGYTYVFRFDGINWLEPISLTIEGTEQDFFGTAVALSADGDTLAVGADGEDRSATGVHPAPPGNTWPRIGNSGAAYVYRYDGTAWNLEAYIKASNTGSDGFGRALDLSDDGMTLAVGAASEDSAATGVGGDQSDETLQGAGAVYIFRYGEQTWQQVSYTKASNAGFHDFFGGSIALDHDGKTLAVGAAGENSNATGVGGNQNDNSVEYAGAAYVY